MAVNLERHGPTALVTGAAQGLGAAMARSLRRRGFEVVMVDRQAERLASLARTLGGEPVAMDLAAPDAVEDLVAALGDREVGLVIHNAAFSPMGPLATTPQDDLEAVLAVNCRVPLMLTRALLPAMQRRGRGGVMFLSSMIAFHGGPDFAAYAASRGFALALGESLWSELRGTGIDVMVTCPGATDTEGFRETQPDPRVLKLTPLSRPDDAAEEALDAFGEAGPTRLLGAANRAAEVVMGRLLPRRLASQLIAGNLRRLYRR